MRNTAHGHETGAPALETVYWVTHRLSHEELTAVTGTDLDSASVRRCGRCFDDGGYRGDPNSSRTRPDAFRRATVATGRPRGWV